MTTKNSIKSIDYCSKCPGLSLSLIAVIGIALVTGPFKHKDNQKNIKTDLLRASIIGTHSSRAPEQVSTNLKREREREHARESENAYTHTHAHTHIRTQLAQAQIRSRSRKIGFHLIRSHRHIGTHTHLLHSAASSSNFMRIALSLSCK